MASEALLRRARRPGKIPSARLGGEPGRRLRDVLAARIGLDLFRCGEDPVMVRDGRRAPVARPRRVHGRDARPRAAEDGRAASIGVVVPRDCEAEAAAKVARGARQRRGDRRVVRRHHAVKAPPVRPRHRRPGRASNGASEREELGRGEQRGRGRRLEHLGRRGAERLPRELEGLRRGHKGLRLHFDGRVRVDSHGLRNDLQKDLAALVRGGLADLVRALRPVEGHAPLRPPRLAGVAVSH
mmetsp:Transcript_6584/g.21256  ORF Transcript_6584/g.21256 Transcript_6584/m.21256 type:complete len:241 (-) Transcript_6584:77-799(-)